MNNFIYVFINKNLDVWDNLNEAIIHYLRIYEYFPRDLHNPKYMNIVNKLKAGNRIIVQDKGKYETIIDHTNCVNSRDTGTFIFLFKEYDKEKMMDLWNNRFLKIRNVGSEFNVSFKSLMPLENFTEKDFEKFYKRLFESFDIKIHSIKVTNMNDIYNTFKAIINENIEMEFCYGNKYETISDKIDFLVEKVNSINKEPEEEIEK